MKFVTEVCREAVSLHPKHLSKRSKLHLGFYEFGQDHKWGRASFGKTQMYIESLRDLIGRIIQVAHEDHI
jgi:hypothetical protein